jgi:hypothetical protein
MTWDGIPWAVGGGAEHTPETARTAIYVATGGAEGVVAATDLRVVPTAVPGGSIRVLPGAALIRSRATGGSQQTYTARNPSEDVVAIAPTGSQSGRSDLIVARVEDPFMPGEPWQDPADPKVGPYVFSCVISNVPAGSTTHASVGSGIVLARIDLPANTGTVQASHIVDLRKVAIPQRTRDLYTTPPTTTTDINSVTVRDLAPQSNRTLTIPTWASQVKIIGTIAGVRAITANVTGNVLGAFGSVGGLSGVAYDLDVTSRATLMVSDTLAIPAALRGTSQVLRMQANRTSATGVLRADQYTTVLWDVEFLEVASAD